MKSLFLFLLFSIIAYSSFAQWEQLSGPKNSFGANKIFSKDSILFVSTSCGTYYSFNNGAKWTALDANGFSSATVFNNTPYFASNSYDYDISGLSKITYLNGGLKNVPINYFFPEDYINYYGHLPFFYSDSNTIYQISCLVGYSPSFAGGFSYSTDAVNWVNENIGLVMDSTPASYDPSQPPSYYYNLLSLNGNSNYLYLGTDHGLYKSTKGDFTWRNVNNGIPPLPVTSILCKDSVIIISAQTQSSSSILSDSIVIYKSTDNGNSWYLKHIIPLSITNELKNINGTFYLSTTGQGLFASYDNGETWVRVNTGSFNNIYSIEQCNNQYFIATDSGIYKNLTQLTNTNNNILCSGVSKIAATGSSIACAFNNINFLNPTISISKDDGMTWKNLPAGYSDIASINNSYIVLGTSGVYLYNNSTDSLKLISTSGIFPYSGYSIISNQGTLLALLEYGSLLFSKDGGETWIDTTPPVTNDYCAYYTALPAMNAIYLSGQCSGQLYKSLEWGVKWQLIDSGLGGDVIYTLGYFNGIMFAGGEYNTYRSLDGGMGWQTCSNGLPGNYIYSSAFASDNKNIYTCTTGHVYVSNDSGLNWKDISGNLPLMSDESYSGGSLLVSNGYLYFGTSDLGIWRTGILPGYNTADSSVLLFPNPATTQFYISPFINNIQRADIFNLSGQLMLTTLVNENTINISSLANGFYIVRIVTPGKNYYGKIVKD